MQAHFSQIGERALHRIGRGIGSETIKWIGLLLLAAFLFVHIGFDQPINEDFSVYLQEAENILHHKPLQDVGVVYRPDPAGPLGAQDPLIYPPLLPMLYAPVVSIVGLDLNTLMTLQFLALVAAFVLLWRFRARLGFSEFEVGASLLLFALQNATLRSINDLGSDIPFLPVLIAALIAIEKFTVSIGRSRWLWAALAGVTIFFAADLRSVGIVLIPAAIATEFLRRKFRFSVDTLILLTCFLLLWIAQRQIVGQASAYDYIFHYKFFDVASNLRSFFWTLALPWKGTRLELVAEVVVALLSLVAATGVLSDVRNRSSTAIFVSSYTLLLLVLPNFNAGPRYLVPLLMFLGAYVVKGCQWMAERVRLERKWLFYARAVPVAVGGALLLVAPGALAINRDEPVGMRSPQTVAMFNFLREHTAGNSLVAASKYRAVHLFSERRTIRIPASAQANSAVLFDWCLQEKVAYLVVKYSTARPSPLRSDFSDCPANPLCREKTGNAIFARLFENPDYMIFQPMAAR